MGGGGGGVWRGGEKGGGRRGGVSMSGLGGWSRGQHEWVQCTFAECQSSPTMYKVAIDNTAYLLSGQLPSRLMLQQS